MHKTKLITYVLLIVTFAGISIASSSELQKKGFSISLPDGWVEIPRDVIDSHEKETARLLPNAKAQHYDYAFQLDSSKNWFELPYILIHVNNTYRIPNSQLEKMEKLKGYSTKKIINEVRKDYIPMLSDIRAGKMVYDKQNKIIWMRLEANLVNTGSTSSLSGIVLTEKGSIEVHGSSLRENYRAYEPIFQSVAKSISLEPNLVYKSR